MENKEMTLRVLVSRPSGVVLVRMHGALHDQLKVLSVLSTTGPELQEEVNMCLSKLERLPKPPPVTVTNLSSTDYIVSWERCEPESSLEVTYSLFDRDVMLYRGQLCQVTLPVSANRTMDSIFLRVNLSTSDGDASPFSDPVGITVEPLDTTLQCPQELCVSGCTATHARLRWLEPGGGVKPKSYEIYCNDTLVKTTMLLGAVVSGLSPGTPYVLSVRSLCPGHTASPRAVTEVRTADDQDHAPSAVTVVILGRHELQINWRAPSAPLGRLFKYELSLNGCVPYVGTERAYTARRLSANTAYTCIVTAITSRGRCHSRPVTKNTARDEYLPSNRYLYSPTHQTTPKPSSPTIQKTSEVTKMTTNSQITLKPKIHSTRGQHKAPEFRKDKHRRLSVQIHIPKGNESFNHTSKMDKDSPAVVFPMSSTDPLVVPSHGQCEDIHQTQAKSSTPEDHTHVRTKIRQARQRNRKVSKETLPCISKQISEDVRLLQPVSFNLSNLERTKEQIRAQRDRNKTISKVQNQHRGRQ